MFSIHLHIILFHIFASVWEVLFGAITICHVWALSNSCLEQHLNSAISSLWNSLSSASQAAGLATMISTMRPDIDNMDEYVRNTTARAFAVVASALGIPSLLPFLKAVCKSKKSWQARHTGIKIVQQIAILMGCAILPHLRSLVEIIEHGQLT